MLKTTVKSTISTYFLCNFLFWLVANINYNLVGYYFETADLTLTEVSLMNYYRMIGVGLSAFILIVLYSLVDIKKLLIFSLMLYLVSQINLVLASSIDMVRLHYLLLSTGGSLIIFLLFGLMLINIPVNKELSLTFFFGSLVLGFIVSDVALDYILFTPKEPNLNSIMGMNMIPVFLMISLLMFNDSLKITRVGQPNSIVNIIRYMELESLQGFVLFFILMIIAEGNDVYEVTNSLVYLTVNNTRYYMAAALLLSLYPVTKFIVKHNSHKLNLINLLALTILFGTISLWTKYIQFGFICWILITLMLYQLLVNNVLLLSEKFSKEDQFASFIIYFLMCAFGFYSGYVTIMAVEESLGEEAFTLSITIVLAAIFLYYLFRFVKDKLYKW